MDQVLYSLPDGWEWIQLGEALDVRDGTHDSPKYVDSGFPLVTSKNITGKGLDLKNVKYISQEDFDAINKRSKVDVGDILFAMIGTIGFPTVITDEPNYAIKNVALFKKRQDDQTMDFFKYFLESPYAIESMLSQAKGAAQKFVGLKVLRNFNVPLPTKPEQKRIVEKLDALLTRIDTAIHHLQESVTLADALFSSALNRAFNPSGSKVNLDSDYVLPEDWDWRAVKELSKKIQYGHTSKAAEKGNAQFLRITDIQDNNIDWTSVPFVELSEKEIKKYALAENDLVFARSGATAGKSILIKEPPKNAIFASYLIRIIPDLELIQPEYIELFFKSPAYWDTVKVNASGAAQPNINGTKLGEFKVPTPRLEIQKSIVDEMSSLSARVTDLKRKLRNKVSFLESTKSSILDSAFKGEL